MTLDGLAALLSHHFPRKQVDGVRTVPKVNLVRYADDCVPRAQGKPMSLFWA